MHVWTGYFSDAQDGIDLYKSSTNDQLIDLFKLIDLSKSPTNDQLISIEMVENAMHCWCQQLSVLQIPQMFSIYKLMIRKWILEFRKHNARALGNPYAPVLKTRLGGWQTRCKVPQ